MRLKHKNELEDRNISVSFTNNHEGTLILNNIFAVTPKALRLFCKNTACTGCFLRKHLSHFSPYTF